MRIVEQARLGYREGNSDKVYEVELVEVAADQYAVNFRFGRRGSALRSGTKTSFPVALDKARRVFSTLVAEKTNAGYQALETAAARTDTPLDAATQQARTAQTLLAALGRGHRGAVPLHWVVRKVGERGLQEAEPLLLELLAAGSPQSGSKPEVLRHFLLAALARCGSSRALAPLQAIVDDVKAPRHLRDVARLALTMVGGPDQRRRVQAGVPAELLATSGDELASCIRAAERLLITFPEQARAAILALYASAPAVSSDAEPEPERLSRRIVLGVARVARLRGVERGLLRSLNFAAELRRDGELFALLTRRFESQRLDAPNTANYFRRRAARTLQRLGRVGSPDYVAMAAELCLLYRDDDAEPVLDFESGTWDAFGGYHALNFILFGRSSRYERAGHRRATWRCRSGYVPGQPAPSAREESYPELWDQAPELLWRLGVSPAASVVIDFATRALRNQTDYLAEIADLKLASALARAQRPMRILAFEVARRRTPNVTLARGALASELEEANAWVLAWVQSAPAMLRTEGELLALLLTAKSEPVRGAVAGLTRDWVIEDALASTLVSASIAILMELPEEPAAQERAATASAFLLERAASALARLSVAVLRDLLGHAVPAVAELGAELVLRQARQTALEDGLLDAMLGSRHMAVRATAARIIAETPVSVMKDEPTLLVHFALSENAELREGTRALLGEVARLYPEVGRELASRLLDALLSPQPEGAPAHVVSLLRRELHACLPKRDADQVLSMVGALSPHARQAAGLLVALLTPDELELDAIVRLANHEILLIRQGAWALARAAKARFRIAPVALSRLCDARWEDSRAFAFEFVRTFAPSDLVPDGVIAICDSVEPAVQQFGQSLLLEHWQDAHATRYLLRLSEHPSTNIQLLVTSLLERHAHGNLQLLEQLLPCLTTVLSQVNRGGVAKQRVLEFLRQEALVNAAAAVLLAPLLERQSLTRAVSHRAPLVATMVAVHERYPEVPLPVATALVPLHTRSNRGI